MISEEGTYQGDPLAMVVYALSILPLITGLQVHSLQVWCTDDATDVGSLEQGKPSWMA